MGKYYECPVFEQYYDRAKNEIALEHDSLSFVDDTRAVYAKVSQVLDKVFDELFAEMESELQFFTPLGQIKEGVDIFNGADDIMDEVIEEAIKYGGVLPANSEAGGVYHVHLTRTANSSDFKSFYGDYEDDELEVTK